MPRVESAEDAVSIAEQLLRRYYPFRRLQTAKGNDGGWLVEFDVGVLKVEIVRLRIDANTGKIMECTKPALP